MIASRPREVDGAATIPKPAGPRSFRVLKIAPTSFFSDYGCHVRILEETLALQALGSRVTICTYHSGSNVRGLDIRRTLGLPGRNRVHVGSSPLRFILDALLSLRAMLATIQVRPDIIHAHLHEGALIGGILSRLWRVPLVFDFQGSLTSEMIDHGFLKRESAIYRPLYWLEGVIDRSADVILTSTHHSANLLIREFGCLPERVRPLPDAVNTGAFVPRWSVPETAKLQLRQSLGIPQGRRLVVYLGLLAEYQGLSHLLRAAARITRELPDVHFLLMGYPGQDRYRAMAESLGIGDHVTFTGRLPYDQAPLHLALGDLALAPKISQTEGNGKLLNYMAVGLPTVAFDTPVNRDILGDIGEYATLGDADDLARQALRLLSDGATADERGRQLRQRAVELFSWASAGERILDVYESLVGQPCG